MLDGAQDTDPVRRPRSSLSIGGAFLEAKATVSGTLFGEPVNGHAYLEVMPVNRIGRFEGFLERLRELTDSEVRALYPDLPGADVTASMTGGDPVGPPHTTVHEALVRPMWHITDASGRGWRTFIACAAIELFDVRCDPYTPLLAVAELVRCACLVIDDVEVGSPLRRGALDHAPDVRRAGGDQRGHGGVLRAGPGEPGGPS